MIGGFRSNPREETIFLKHSYFHVDEHSFTGYNTNDGLP